MVAFADEEAKVRVTFKNFARAETDFYFWQAEARRPEP